VVAEHVRAVLRSSKDAALAFGVRSYLNTRLRGIGEMTELSIDTKKQAFRVRLDLVGEAQPIEIHVKKYVLRGIATATTRLLIVEATASRQWLAKALREFVAGRSFTIPAKAGAALKLLT
jgi:hypothetical protein